MAEINDVPNPGPSPDPGAPPWKANPQPVPTLNDFRLGQIQGDPTLAGVDEVGAMATALRKFLNNTEG